MLTKMGLHKLLVLYIMVPNFCHLFSYILAELQLSYCIQAQLCGTRKRVPELKRGQNKRRAGMTRWDSQHSIDVRSPLTKGGWPWGAGGGFPAFSQEVTHVIPPLHTLGEGSLIRAPGLGSNMAVVAELLSQLRAAVPAQGGDWLQEQVAAALEEQDTSPTAGGQGTPHSRRSKPLERYSPDAAHGAERPPRRPNRGPPAPSPC